MALTSELLKGNTATSSLTDEQISAIVTMSLNDENSVIAQKTGEIYGGLDADILATSGIAKNGAEKTYDYAKRVIGDIISKRDEYNTQITSLTAEKTRLEGIIAKGGSDEETRTKLTQAQTDLANVTKQYTDLRAEFDTLKTNHANELYGLRLDGELDKASASLKFKDGMPEAVTNIIIANARQKIKGMPSDYIDDGKGGKVLAFKDDKGAILRNPENQLNPFTTAELLFKELKTMGILDEGRRTTGSGSQTTPPSQTATLDISSARTQLEADEIITRNLLAQGLVNGSSAFQQAKTKAWIDNNVKALPLR